MVLAYQKSIRVLLSNPHPIVSWGLEKLVNNELPRREVVRKAMCGVETKLLAADTKPDILLLDLAFSQEGTCDLLPNLLEG